MTIAQPHLTSHRQRSFKAGNEATRRHFGGHTGIFWIVDDARESLMQPNPTPAPAALVGLSQYIECDNFTASEEN